MSQFQKFSFAKIGTRWPIGGFVEVAMIDIRCEDVEKVLSSSLIDGVEPGMGPWKAIGIRLDTGEMIELIKYIYDPDQAFILRVGAGEDFMSVLNRVLNLLGEDMDALVWVSPLLNFGSQAGKQGPE